MQINVKRKKWNNCKWSTRLKEIRRISLKMVPKKKPKRVDVNNNVKYIF